MRSRNIKAIRQAKGLSQAKLADRLHVERQTVSKWEQCLSAPDAELLFALSEAFETPVSTLLGENVEAVKAAETQAFSTKPEAINVRLAQQKRAR